MKSRTPATALASVWRAAKPMTAAARALDARMLVARRSSAANWEIATATPTTAIEASTTRRMKRSRVSVTGSSSIPSRERIWRPWRLMTRSTRKMSTAG